MGLDVAEAVCRAQLCRHYVDVSTLDEDSAGGLHVRLMEKLGTDQGAFSGAQGEDKPLGIQWADEGADCGAIRVRLRKAHERPNGQSKPLRLVERRVSPDTQ